MGAGPSEPGGAQARCAEEAKLQGESGRDLIESSASRHDRKQQRAGERQRSAQDREAGAQGHQQPRTVPPGLTRRPRCLPWAQPRPGYREAMQIEPHLGGRPRDQRHHRGESEYHARVFQLDLRGPTSQTPEAEEQDSQEGEAGCARAEDDWERQRSVQRPNAPRARTYGRGPGPGEGRSIQEEDGQEARETPDD